MPLKKQNPGCNCCGGAEICDRCVSGTANTSYTVGISGLTNNPGCSDCSTLDLSYSVSWGGSPSQGTNCWWSSATQSYCAGKLAKVQLVFNAATIGADTYYSVIVYLFTDFATNQGWWVRWRYNLPANQKINCGSIGSYTLSYEMAQGPVTCDGTAATISLS